MAKVILYIEDNVQNLRLVRKMLSVGGYTMIEAIDGASGYAAALEHLPDLILMDINLPDIDGVEVTRRIKACDETRHIPVVALTANAMFGDRERFINGGCDDYLAKPISKRELLSTLDHFFAGADV